MSLNKLRPHIVVLPEDKANRQLANGFMLDQSVRTTAIQVLPEAGGWMEVLNRFRSDHIHKMDRYPERFMILLIDFDGTPNRLTYAKSQVPHHLIDRVFILGVRTEPEDLKLANLGSYENIGLAMARDCQGGAGGIWDHDLLRNNCVELERSRERLVPVLFSE